MIIGSTAFGCAPVSERRIAYCLAVQFSQNEEQNSVKVCNLAKIGERQQFDKNWTGRAEICQANASGVAIPARQGDIVMLIDRQTGSSPEKAACAYALRFEANEPELSEGVMPRFIFVPTGGSLNDAVEVGYQGLSEYGIENLKVLIVENIDQSPIPDERFLERFGCSLSSLKRGITTSPPACDSLAVYQIPLP